MVLNFHLTADDTRKHNITTTNVLQDQASLLVFFFGGDLEVKGSVLYLPFYVIVTCHLCLVVCLLRFVGDQGCVPAAETSREVEISGPMK